MAKIIVEQVQGGSGGQALTIPTTRASANNQPIVGSTAGALSHSPLSLPAAAAGANNRPLLGSTDASTQFWSVALPSSDGSANQYLRTDGNGTLSFVSIADPTVAIKSSSDPDTTTEQGALGDYFVNTTSGENFVCTFVGTGTTKRRWVGQNGTYVGYPQGQAIYYPAPVTNSYYTNSDTEYTCTVPADVSTVCVVLVGGGGGGAYQWANPGGGGGALAYKNNISVTGGDVLYITVGKGGRQQNNGTDTVIRTGSHTGTVLFKAGGGKHSAASWSNIAKPIAGTLTPDNNANGHGGMSSSNGYGGGGGAGGYSGNGGNGEYGNSTSNSNNQKNSTSAGTGGAAGGGSGYNSSTYGFGGGGGVGLYGEGDKGLQNMNDSNSHYSYSSSNSHEGFGGSGGENGMSNNNSSSEGRTDTWGTTANSETNLITITGSGTPTGSRNMGHAQGGMCGGGGGGGGTSNSSPGHWCCGAPGGARVIWGPGRAFPKTNTGNV